MIFDETLPKPLKRAIDEMGYETATPIQEAAIPLIRQGVDLIGQAQTGSGKTAAFTIPILEKMDPLAKEPQALILSPTRELAVQIAGEVEKLGKYLAVRSMAIFGGQSIDFQIRTLSRGVQVIAGTPGRIKDHINRGTLDLSHVAHVVLDEADEMLDMGFRDDIQEILEATPPQRQTMMFSATLPQEIMELAQRYLQDPEFVQIANTLETLPDIEQSYMVAAPDFRGDITALLLEKLDPKLTLIFCNTRHHVDEVTDLLLARGVRAAALHGEMRQAERDIVMGRFRGGLLPVLIATDVAARGLDVENVELVINYDLPRQMENYIHRIGRTGRAGKSGRAVCFVTSRDYHYIQRLQQFTKVPMARMPMPSRYELEERRAVQLIGKVVEASAQGIPLRYEKWAHQMLLSMNQQSELAVAALMQLAMQGQGDALEAALPQQELPFEPEKPRRPERKEGRYKGKGASPDAQPSYAHRNHKPEHHSDKPKAYRKADKPEKTVSKKKEPVYRDEPSFYGAAARRKAKASLKKEK